MVTPNDLATARRALDLTQSQLAEKWGVNVATIWRWENEQIPDRGPGRALIVQIIAEAKAAKSERAA